MIFLDSCGFSASFGFRDAALCCLIIPYNPGQKVVKR
nr:MAG TPA: hypothetical protein [Caudoviricetes sp.]